MSDRLWTVLPAPKPWPAARILHGSVVHEVVWGFTRGHALHRALHRVPFRSQAADQTHECVFVEEQEPSGRLILPPCIVCGFTAMDALEQMRQETGR